MLLHSLMPVLLNGGSTDHRNHETRFVALADACVTEWRRKSGNLLTKRTGVALADACVTEWRRMTLSHFPYTLLLHSLMPVLLNGGSCFNAVL